MREFLEDCAARVYRFALRLTRDHARAEDLAQEALLRAWRHRERLRSPLAARSWLFRIAVNVWQDQLRRRRSHRDAIEDVIEAAEPVETRLRRPDQLVQDQEDVEQVMKSIGDLPPRQRQVIHLHAIEGLPLDEIARVLSISPEAARGSLFLGRRALRRALDGIQGRRE